MTPKGLLAFLLGIESLGRPFGGICFMLHGRGGSCPEVLCSTRPRLLFPLPSGLSQALLQVSESAQASPESAVSQINAASRVLKIVMSRREKLFSSS